MNDLERDLRAALDEQASSAPPPHDRGRVVARTRRRQGVAIASGVLGVAVVVLLSLVATRAIRTPDGVTPATPGVETSSPTQAPHPEVPEPTQLEHGGVVWGVYLAIDEDFEDPALAAATARAEAYGYSAGVGEVACDQPAAETLGVPPDSAVVAIYFDTRADAETAAALFEPSPVGIVKVTTFCLD